MLDLVDSLRLKLDSAAPDVVAIVGGGGKTSTLFRLTREIVSRRARAIATVTARMAAVQRRASPAVVVMEGDSVPLDALARALDAHGQCLLVGPTEDEMCTGVSLAALDRVRRHARQLGLAAFVVEADGSRTLPIKAPASHEPVVPPFTTHLVPTIGLDAVGRRIVAGEVHRPERIRSLLGIDNHSYDTARLAPAQIARLLTHGEGGAKRKPPTAALIPLLNKAERPERRAMARLIARCLTAQGYPALIAATGLSTDAPLAEVSETVFERWQPTAVVVLAAGRAQRMGRAKQLVEVDGEAMALRAARVALASGADQVVVVTGAHAAQVESLLAPLRATGRLRFVHNLDWANGQSTSMQAGLYALDETVGCALFVPTDQPFLPSLLLRRMLARWRQGANIVAPSIRGALRGAPGLFDRSVWPELWAIKGDTGARALLQIHQAEVASIPAEAAWLRDIDTPQDLAGE